jgi:Ca2+-binding RTX toxin-like protein
MTAYSVSTAITTTADNTPAYTLTHQNDTLDVTSTGVLHASGVNSDGIDLIAAHTAVTISGSVTSDQAIGVSMAGNCTADVYGDVTGVLGIVLNGNGAGTVTVHDGGSVTGTDGYGIKVGWDAAGSDLHVDGEVSGTTSGIAIGYVDGSGNTNSGTLDIGETGIVQGDDFGVTFISEYGGITNAGEISGASGIYVRGNWESTIRNDGTIEATDGTALAFSHSQSVYVNNYGTITGATSFDLAAHSGIITVQNFNTVEGDVHAPSGAIFVNNKATGTWTANTFDMSYGGDVYNDGTMHITNGVVFGTGSHGTSHFENTADFTGDVTVNSDRFGFTNTGSLHGDIALNGARNTWSNSGDIYGDVLLRAVLKPVNAGVIHGDLTLGDSAHTLNNTAGWVTGKIFGGDGIDTITGGSYKDIVRAGAGGDAVSGGGHADLIFGGAGDDALQGNTANDVINGNLGVDRLQGNSGDDVLNGGSGDDFLRGGDGNDMLTGGTGSDRFVFTAGFEQQTITDFVAGSGPHHDVIRFQGGDPVLIDFAAVQTHMHKVGSDVVITASSGHTITLENVHISHLVAEDFLFS